MTAQPTVALPATTPRPSLLGVARDQRRTIGVAFVLVVGSFWVLGPLSDWLTAACAAAGILLALFNHLATEHWLARLISSGAEPTRQRIAASTFVRLAILSLVAVGVAVLLWPSGVALLFGLAIFRLIALVMTGIPLLRELRNS